METHLRRPVMAAIIVGSLALSLVACSTLAAQQTFEEGDQSFANEEWQAAVASYSEALTLNPELVEAYRNRGLSYVSLGEYDAAIADFDAFIALNDQDADIYLARGRANAALEDYEAARLDFTRSIELNPELVDACFERARVLIILDHAEQAAADLEQVRVLDPDRDISTEQVQVEMMQGDAHREQGELQDALDHYAAAIEIDPDALAYTSRGDIYLAQGDYQSAVADFTAAIDDDPGRIEAYSSSCVAYYSMGAVGEAMTACTHAIDMIEQGAASCDSCIVAYFWRGHLDAAADDPEAAIADFSSYIVHDDHNATAYYMRGSAYAATHDYLLAIEDYGRAIQSDPALAAAYNDRARYESLTGGDLAQALDDANTAIELAPDPAYFDTRGLILYELGRYALALLDFDRAIEAGYPYAYYGRALVHDEQGEDHSAIDDYRAFLDAYPDSDPQSSDARQRLDLLEAIVVQGHSLCPPPPVTTANSIVLRIRWAGSTPAYAESSADHFQFVIYLDGARIGDSQVFSQYRQPSQTYSSLLVAGCRSDRQLAWVHWDVPLGHLTAGVHIIDIDFSLDAPTNDGFASLQPGPTSRQTITVMVTDGGHN